MIVVFQIWLILTDEQDGVREVVKGLLGIVMIEGRWGMGPVRDMPLRSFDRVASSCLEPLGIENDVR